MSREEVEGAARGENEEVSSEEEEEEVRSGGGRRARPVRRENMRICESWPAALSQRDARVS